MGKFIQENKIVTTIFSLFIVSILGWGTWVTVQIFEQHTYAIIAQNSEKSVTRSMEEVKIDIKEFKKDVKQDLQRIEEQNNRKQEEMIRLLLEIKKNTKN